MYYFLTASKDASVYLQQPDQNTGLDEVLEVSKVYYGNIKDVVDTFKHSANEELLIGVNRNIMERVSDINTTKLQIFT